MSMSGHLRILHLRASPFVGGPERQILRCAAFDFGENVQQIVGSFVDEHEGKDLLDAAGAKGIETVSFSPGSRTALAQLRAYIRKENISMLCTHGFKADVLGIIAGRRESIPVASFLRGWTAQDWKVRLYEQLDRSMLPFASAVVALSQSQAEKLKAPREKRHVVTNVIETRELSADASAAARRDIRARFGLPAESRVVVCAGRLSPEKGTKYFVQAAQELTSHYPDVRFTIFGEGIEKASLAAAVSGTPSIVLAGHITDFKELLPGADVLVNPSLMEEMPNVVLEAMSCGVPVIATAVGGVAELAGPDPTIVLVPPADPAAISQKLARLLDSPTEARSFAAAAQNRIRTCYSPEKQKSELEALFERLLPAFAPASTKPVQSVRELPFITVAMPVRNEEKHIQKVLDALLKQEYPKDKYEIIIADGESTDRTREIVEHVARTAPLPIRLINNPRRLSSAGRNIGILNGRGDIVAFIDGHCIIGSDRWLRNVADLIQETGAACLCRPQPLDDPANTSFQDMIAKCRGSVLGHGLDSSIFSQDNERFIDPTSSGAVYTRQVFDKVGIYDEAFDAAEDVEFNHRVRQSGLKSYISPRLTIHYAPRADLRGLFKQMMRYGQGRFRLIAKHRDAISLSQFVPPAFVAWMILAVVLSAFVPLARWAFLGTLSIYLVAVIVSSIALAVKHGFRFLWGGPVIYATIHVGLGVGFWKGLFSGYKPVPVTAAARSGV